MGTFGSLDQALIKVVDRALIQVVFMIVEVLFPCPLPIAYPEMHIFCPYCDLII